MMDLLKQKSQIKFLCEDF